MSIFRSRRIETVLGAPVDELTAAHIKSLVDAKVGESFDLDFKSELYGTTDSQKRDLAGDVAAMANTAGGVIILGVEEDDQARASGVALSDDERLRMSQIIGTLSPMPRFEINDVPSKLEDRSHGWYVIAVPRSVMAPHAVPVNHGWRYPRRNDTGTRYLAEPEIAAAYRTRDLGGEGQNRRLSGIERDLRARLDPEVTWLTVSVVPELDGEVLINSDTFAAFQQRVVRKSLPLIGGYFETCTVGRRRFLANDGQHSGAARHLALDLHADGGGGMAMGLWNMASARSVPLQGDAHIVGDEEITQCVIGALMYLASAARDAAAGGMALLRATLVPPVESSIGIGQARFHGFAEAITEVRLTDIPPATGSALLDDVAEPGPPLLRVARDLAAQLGQSFGIPEMMQIAADGSLRAPYWQGRENNPICQWAQGVGIPVAEE
jgi:hypothetical protein